MTREEAITILSYYDMGFYDINGFPIPAHKLAEACDMAIEALSAWVEIIHCKECAYYDPPHIENEGRRHEYKDMPKDAFDKLGTGLVYSGYGINVGGRCLRDYNAVYAEDKRVFVNEENYCGRAIKGGEQSE